MQPLYPAQRLWAVQGRADAVEVGQEYRRIGPLGKRRRPLPLSRPTHSRAAVADIANPIER